MVIAGTGGQGVLTAARLLCDVFVDHGHDVVSGQLHGMAQRGGSVQSTIQVDCGVCPVIPRGGADVVLGFEPVETARVLPLMSASTVVYMNTAPVVPYVVAQRTVLDGEKAEYPNVEQLAEAICAVTPYVCSFDATQAATEAGSARALNVVMLGCLVGSGWLPCTMDEFWEVVARKTRPALRDVNKRALAAGAAMGKRFALAEARP
jgi:indolepyruvate ferredoxin oxidoreductase beta subunit